MAQLKVDLECYKQTEGGDDEIYILVAIQRSDGVQISKRYPADAPGQDAGHWSMSNSDLNKRYVNGVDLGTIDVHEGQTATYVVLVMEEDGGNTKTAQEILAAVLGTSKDPNIVAAGGILGTLTLLGLFAEDSDDYIGSFAVIVTNKGGYTIEWIAKDRVHFENAEGFYGELAGQNAHRFHMNGDGSDYAVTCYLY